MKTETINIDKLKNPTSFFKNLVGSAELIREKSDEIDFELYDAIIMHFYHINPDELTLERYRSLLNCISDIIELENSDKTIDQIVNDRYLRRKEASVSG